MKSLLSWLRPRSLKDTNRKPRPSSYRPHLEDLETRVVPAGPAITLGGSTGIEDITQTQAFTWNTSAPFVNFDDFHDTTPLTLNGIATKKNTVDGTVLRLVPASNWQHGSAFSTLKGDASSFSTSFKFRITNPGGSSDGTNTGADGMVFVIQNVSSSIGSSGGGIGYAGIPFSVGVKFDTWQNTGNHDPSSNYLGIATNGNIDNGVGAPHTVNVSPRFDDGNIWYAWVDYDGTTLEVRANQTGLRPAAPILSQALDIPAILNSSFAYLGFTSGTGGAYENVDILGWKYTNPSGGVSVNITQNGNTIYSTTDIANAVGSFNFDPYGIGTYQIDVTATDLLSNTSRASRSVTVVNAAVSLTPSTLAMLEGKSAQTFVTLKQAPLADITIDLVTDPLEASVSPSSVTFTPANWKVPQLLTVTSVDNTNVDGNRTVDLVPTFNGLTFPAAPMDIVDNDNVLFINGTEKPDKISVLFAPGVIQVSFNGSAFFYDPSAYSQVVVLAGAGNDTVQLFNPTIPVAVLGDQGVDTVQIDGQSAANDFTLDTFTVDVNGKSMNLGLVENALINGKGAADVLTVASLPVFTTTFQGGAGKDTIVAPNQANTWKITNIDAGTLDASVVFASAENLSGGAADDTYAFAAAKLVTGMIDGGLGNNTLDFSAYKTAVTVSLQPAIATVNGRQFQNVTTIRGGLALDKMIGPNASNLWNMTDANAGDVAGLSFTSFENLTGGSMDDTFLLAADLGVKGKIDGGGGTDVLDYSNYFGPVTINLQTKTATNIGGFLNIEQFHGGGSTGNTLVGANLTNVWNLTGTNSGDVNGSLFANFENLVGGRLADTFNVMSGGDWLGLLDGGMGINTLNTFGTGSYTPDPSNPSAGTVNGCSFKSIANRR